MKKNKICEGCPDCVCFDSLECSDCRHYPKEMTPMKRLIERVAVLEMTNGCGLIANVIKKIDATMEPEDIADAIWNVYDDELTKLRNKMEKAVEVLQ